MDLFDQMPWVKTLFAWLVIATAVILFLSIPSYLILAPIARAVRDALLIHLVTTAKTYWGRTMSDAMQTATQVRKAIQSAEQSVRELADSVPILEFRDHPLMVTSLVTV